MMNKRREILCSMLIPTKQRQLCLILLGTIFAQSGGSFVFHRNTNHKKNKKLMVTSGWLLTTCQQQKFNILSSSLLQSSPSSTSSNSTISTGVSTSSITTTTGGGSPSSMNALEMQQKAIALREEINNLQKKQKETKEAKIQKKNEKIDKWIDQLLVNQTINDDTQLLNTVDRVFQVMKDNRFSQQQINNIFNRMCEDRPQSRSNLSPIVGLLVDAAGELDKLERVDNPNKRWNGKVERELRKRLFAADYGIDLEASTQDDDKQLMI